MTGPDPGARPAACAACGVVVPSRLLQCPRCGRLVHADRLKELAARAEREESEGRLLAAVATWREALALLPQDAAQSGAIGERIEALLARPEARSARRDGRSGPWGGIAIAGLVAILAGGLTKIPALLGLFGMFGVLWSVYGWKLAALVLLSLYLHEIGHAAMMWKRGMAVSAPMFVPGLGAYVRMTERPATPVEDNRIGLAGPVAGLAVALAFAAAGLLTDAPLLLATAHVGALLNMLNLLPVWQLDGARGFASLTRGQRVAVAAAMGLAAAATRDGLVGIIAIVAFAVALGGRPAGKPDHPGLVTFLGLVGALAGLAAIPVPQA